MQVRQRQSGAMLCLAAAVLVMVGYQPLLGLDNLPSDVYRIKSEPTPDQQQTLDQYASFWCDKLRDGTDQDVVKAREKLIEPLTRGGTKPFVKALSASISGPVAGAAESERLLSRLNAMIVADKLNKDEAALRLMMLGLKDDSPGVRYWAGRAIVNAVDSLTRKVQIQILEQLGQLIHDEPSIEVLEQVFLGILALPLTEAVETVHVGLNQRVQLRIGKPQLPYRAELAGLRGLFQRLLRLAAEGHIDPDEALRQTARASVRFMLLLAEQAQNAVLAEELENDYFAMAKMCDKVLRYARDRFNIAEPAPPKLPFNPVWKDIKNIAHQWRQILTNDPFNLTEEDLSIELELE